MIFTDASIFMLIPRSELLRVTDDQLCETTLWKGTAQVCSQVFSQYSSWDEEHLWSRTGLT